MLSDGRINGDLLCQISVNTSPLPRTLIDKFPEIRQVFIKGSKRRHPRYYLIIVLHCSLEILLRLSVDDVLKHKNDAVIYPQKELSLDHP